MCALTNSAFCSSCEQPAIPEPGNDVLWVFKPTGEDDLDWHEIKVPNFTPSTNPRKFRSVGLLKYKVKFRLTIYLLGHRQAGDPEYYWKFGPLDRLRGYSYEECNWQVVNNLLQSVGEPGMPSPSRITVAAAVTGLWIAP